jgi:hypothetical protein
MVSKEELLAALRDHLTIEVTHGSTDPEDDSRVVQLWFDDVKISEATL